MREWLKVEAVLPISKAVCVHAACQRQRTAIGWVPQAGANRTSYLLKLKGENVVAISLDHRPLQRCLEDLGAAFITMAEKHGYAFTGDGIFAYGPYPAYAKGRTAFAGEVQRVDPDRQADAILKGMGYVPDACTYRLAGEFTASMKKEYQHAELLAV